MAGEDWIHISLPVQQDCFTRWSPAGIVIMALHCAFLILVLMLVTANSSCLDCSGAGIPRCQAAAPRPSTATRPMFSGPLQLSTYPSPCTAGNVHLSQKGHE